MFEYIKDNYDVEVVLGNVIYFDGERGLVTEDRGHYIGVTFDKDKPGTISNIHPTDEKLDIRHHIVELIRRMTRSQKNYQEYLHSEVDVTFAEWMGFK